MLHLLSRQFFFLRYGWRNLINLSSSQQEHFRYRVYGHIPNTGSRIHVAHCYLSWHQERIRLAILFLAIDWLDHCREFKRSGMCYILHFKQKNGVISWMWCCGHFMNLRLTLLDWIWILAVILSGNGAHVSMSFLICWILYMTTLYVDDLGLMFSLYRYVCRRHHFDAMWTFDSPCVFTLHLSHALRGS